MTGSSANINPCRGGSHVIPANFPAKLKKDAPEKTLQAMGKVGDQVKILLNVAEILPEEELET